MTKEQAETVAKLIVIDIMKNDSGKADRLVLTIDAVGAKPARDLGGWGRGPLIDRIAKNLVRMQLTETGRQRSAGWGS